MTEKLEFIVNKKDHILSIQNNKVETGHAYYIHKEDELYNTIQIFYRDRVPTNINNSSIARIFYGIKLLSKERYTDIIVDNYYIKKNGERMGLEIKLPIEKYYLKIID